MGKDRDIERAIASGERNKRTIELVHNWCAHARVKKLGGTGFIELQTGLPIGHHAMECDHAPAGGMASWEFADAAVDFHDRNCVGCLKRRAVRLPNLSELVAERDRARAREDAARERREKAAQEASVERIRIRGILRAAHQVAAVHALLDDVERLDLERSDVARTRIVETARLAPEVFTPSIVAHFFDLLDAREHWFVETGLRALWQLGVDKRRLVNFAMQCLWRHDAVETAASIAQQYVDDIDEAMVSKSVGALVWLARPPRSSLAFDRTRELRPGPLLAVFGRWPDQVCSGIENLLDQRHPYSVSTAARASGVLVNSDSSIPLRFARSLAAKLVRAHLLLDENKSSPDMDDACIDLQDALSLALLADPLRTDEMLVSYYDGASSEGETRLVGVYERLFFRVRREDGVANGAAYVTALRRLVWLATRLENQEVLREVLNAFHGEPDALIEVARSQLDTLLGAAALMDDRVERFNADARLQKFNNVLEALERENERSILYQLMEAFARWAAVAAGDSDDATRQYVEFLGRVAAHRDELSSTLIGQAHFLMHTPGGLNAVLPALYSALVGSSHLTRAMAAEMLGKLSRLRVADLPMLVFEAFVPLLSDPYVVVHRSAVRTLERLDLPKAFDPIAAGALRTLMFVYKDEKASHAFLMDYIALFVQRYLDDEQTRSGAGDVLVALIHGVEPDVAVRELRHIASKLASAKGFAELVLRMVSDDKAMSYLEEDVLNLLYKLPATVVWAARQELVAAALKRVDNSLAIGSFVEVLTRAGAWSEAQTVALAAWQEVPDTIQMRPMMWSTRLLYIAVSFEAAIAEGRMNDLSALAREWRELEDSIEKDRQEYAERRDPLRGFLRPHQGR